MNFKDNLQKMYHDAGFVKPECAEEVYEIYLDVRKENKKAGVGKKWPAHSMYPDYPHVENTTFSAIEIMVAKARNGFSYLEQDFADLGIAGIGHDTGYRVGPNEHERISMEIMGDYLTKRGFQSERVDRIAKAIGWTKVFGDKPVEETELGRLLAAGDALGIIADPTYFNRYLPLLFEEFNNYIINGKTMNEVLGYRTLDGPDGIRGPKSADFVKKVLYPAAAPYMEYFDNVYGGADKNPYRKRIQENIKRLERNI